MILNLASLKDISQDQYENEKMTRRIATLLLEATQNNCASPICLPSAIVVK